MKETELKPIKKYCRYCGYEIIGHREKSVIYNLKVHEMYCKEKEKK